MIHSAKKHHWSQRKLLLGLMLAVFVSTIPITVENPTAVLDMLSVLGILGTLVSFMLGFPGIYLGIKLGQSMGKTLSTLEG